MAGRSEPQPELKTISCTECRRRKAKCDKVEPCGNCAKSSRQCIYETPTRTPLSRKHLNDVEEELARTKRRLAQYEQLSRTENSVGTATAGAAEVPPQYSPQVNFIYPARATNTLSPTQGVETLQDSYRDRNVQGDQLQYCAPREQHTSRRDLTQQSLQGAMRASATQPAHIARDTASKQIQFETLQPQAASGQSSSAASYSFYLERLHAPEGFEWDERNYNSGEVGSSDGMASLTDEASGGYMGIASGAALLRLAGEPLTSDISPSSHRKTDMDKSRGPSPSPIIMTSASQLEPFVNAYFQTYHRLYPIVHESTFKAQFMEVIAQPRSSAWQVLLHIIAAIGAFSSAETVTTVDQALFKAAKARMSFDLLETGNLTMVQALTLLSNYSQKRNKPNSGYNYLGLAKRMAMGIGLHKEFTTWHAKPLVLEMRRRVWFLLYAFDFGAVITFSRPLDMPSEGIEVALPLNIHDRDITPMTQTFPKEVETTTPYTHVRCQASFHLATVSIYARMISTPYPTAGQMLELDANHLTKFESELPPWYKVPDEQADQFRLPCAIMRWRIYNFRILMLRAFLMRQLFLRTQLGNYQDPWPLPLATTDEEEAVQGCLRASSECVNSILGFWYQSRQNVLSCWYALYFLFQAVLIPVMCLRNEPLSPMSDGWRDQIRRTIEVLNDMTRLNEAASKCLEIINSLCGVFLTSDRGPSPINESPQTQLNNLYSYMWPLSNAQLTDDFALQDFPIQDLLQQIGDIS